MASSSHQNPLEGVSRELEKQERGRDWLELGLGLGFCKKTANEQSYPVSSTSALASTSSPSPFPFHNQHLQLYHHQQIQMDLGLGLGLEASARASVGFDYRGVRCMNVAPSSNNHITLLKDQDQDQDQGHNYDHGIPLLPWQIKSSNQLHWQMPMFNNSNDYTTTRPHPGFWFNLISSTNGLGEALPQIQKAYIRVKDENMTILMVKKYLVIKLGLSNEAEIDVSCMGLNLLQTLTLKQVRDVVWLPRLIQSVNSTTLLCQNSQDMCMPLHYGRPCLLNLN